MGRLQQTLFSRNRRHLCTSDSPSFTVHQKLAALAALQEQTDELATQAEKQQLHIRRLLIEQTAVLRERRAAILSGEDLTPDEAALEPVPPDEVPPSLEASLDSYWLEVLQRVIGRSEVANEFAYDWFTQADRDVLRHLHDIKMSCEAGTDPETPHAVGQGSDDTFTLTFFFRPNEFMEPGHETLTVSFERTLGQLRSTRGCNIKWRPGADPTRVTTTDGRGEGVPSFFAIFQPVGNFLFVDGDAERTRTTTKGADGEVGENGEDGEDEYDGEYVLEEEDDEGEFTSADTLRLRSEQLDLTRRVVRELEDVALLNATAIVLAEEADDAADREDEQQATGSLDHRMQSSGDKLLTKDASMAAGPTNDDYEYYGDYEYYDDEADEQEGWHGVTNAAGRQGRNGIQGGTERAGGRAEASDKSCYICGQPGHLARDCGSLRRGGKGSWDGRGKGAGRGGGRAGRGGGQPSDWGGGGDGWSEGGWDGGGWNGDGSWRGDWSTGSDKGAGAGKASDVGSWGGGWGGGRGGGGKGQGGGAWSSGGDDGGDWAGATDSSGGGYGEVHPHGYVDFSSQDWDGGKGRPGKGVGYGYGKGGVGAGAGKGAGYGKGGDATGKGFEFKGSRPRKRYPPFVREEGDTAPVDVAKVEHLLAERNEYRRLQDWAAADRIRDYLKEEMDVTIIDRGGENKWFVGEGGPDPWAEHVARSGRSLGGGKGGKGGRGGKGGAFMADRDDADEYYGGFDDEYDTYEDGVDDYDEGSLGHGGGRGGGWNGGGKGFGGKGFGKGGGRGRGGRGGRGYR